MAQIGTIQSIFGSVTAKTSQGDTRTLQAGDAIHENDTIETSAGATLTILQTDGNSINLGENSTLVLDETVTGKVAAYDAVITDAEAMQQALENGDEINEIDQETAVGEELIDPYEFEVDTLAGDDSKGSVGSYLIDSETGSDSSTYSPFDAATNSAVESAQAIRPSLSLTTDITTDDVINATEAAGNIAITGSVGGDAGNGDAIVLTINGTRYTGTVQDGGFSIDVKGSDLANDPDKTIEAEITSTDASGNAITASTTETYAVDTDAPEATISLDASITSDDVINAAEAEETITVSGSVGGDVVDGDAVTLTVNGETYTGAVAGGRFAIEVQGADLAADPEASVHASVTTTDDAGNATTATHSQGYSVDTVAPEASITLDENIAADGVLNIAEAGGTVTLSGSVGGNVADNDTVTLTVNGETYTGAVAGGRFAIEVQGADLAADPEASVHASVTTTDDAGNATTATHSQGYSVDTVAPEATITLDENIAADGVLNIAEAGGTVTLSGSVGGNVADNDTVTLTVNGETYTGAVAGGRFAIEVQGADLAADPEASVHASVTTTDDAGNATTATHSQGYSVDTVAPEASITLDENIAADGVLNIAEAGGTVTLSGSVGGNVADNDTVTLTVNGETYTGAVAGGRFAIEVQGADLAADPEASVHASVTTTDDAGNATTATHSQGYSVDTVAPEASITLDENIAADGVLNIAEAGGTVTLSGSVGGNVADNDTVTLTVNGETYTGAVAGGRFAIEVQGADLAADPEASVHASVTTTDDAGNATTATHSQGYSVDTVAPEATITLDENIAADGVLNIAEAGGTVTLSGSVGGNVADNDTVTLTVNGETYTGAVAGGRFAIEVQGADLAADPEASVHASVTTTDDAGNATTATHSQGYSVDTVAPEATITLDENIAADGVLNIAEAGGTVTLSGSVGGNVADNDTVTLTVNGETYTGAVAGGRFAIEVQGADLAADPEASVHASVTTTDDAGNATTATHSQVYSVDTVAPEATITLDENIAADGVLNIAEAGGTVTLSGSVGGNVADNDTVTLTVNGETYTGAVAGGRFAIEVQGADLAADPEASVHASVTTTDDAGNATTATHSQGYSVDTVAPEATITLDENIAADGVLNIEEAGGTVTLSGSVGGNVADNDTVTLTVNGETYTGAVAGGRFAIEVQGADLAADPEASVHASVTTTDDAGNATTATHSQGYSVDTVAPEATITLDENIAADGVLNIEEAGGTVTLSGSVGGNVADNDTVTLTVNGETYTGAVAGGRFAIDVQGADLAADPEASVHASVTTTDDAGNATTATHSQGYSVDTVAPEATITLDENIAADGVLNIEEAGGTVTLSGSVGGNVADNDTVTLTVNGETYTGAVAGGRFAIEVQGADLAADPEASVHASVTTTDDAGNATTATHSQGYSVDTVAPEASITLDENIAADGVLNIAEAGGTVTLSGSVGGNVADNDTVTLTVNGETYTGAVAGGRFAIEVQGADLAADPEASVHASVTTTDDAGNATTATHSQGYSVDTVAPEATITLDENIAADGVLNIEEAGGTVTLSGSVGGNVADNDTVTLTVNGETYTGAVAGGRFAIEVQGADLAADPEASVHASVTTTDDAGNATTATHSQGYSVDTVAPEATITLDENIAADGVLNIAEAGGTVTLSGSVGGNVADNDTVTLTVNGETYTGAVAGGRFAIEVQGADLAADPEASVHASVTTTDDAGNATTATHSQGYSVDTVAPEASITLDENIAADGVLNIAEAGGTVTLSGSVGGNVADNDTVTLTVNGETYTGAVAGGRFAIEVQGADLAADPEASVHASVTTTDDAGNATTATHSQGYSVDTVAPEASITLDENITADGVLNIAEAGGTVTLSGSVGGNVADNDTVTLTVNGETYTGAVAGGRFAIEVQGADLAADPEASVHASVTTTDDAGNATTATHNQGYSVDTDAPEATITLDENIAADGVLNIAEAGGTVTLSGSVGGNVADNDTVTLTVNGETYTGAVAGGRFAIEVQGADLAADPEASVHASVTTTDDAGNATTATHSQGYSVDTVAPEASITLDENIAADGVLNIAEAGGTVTLSGSVGGNVADNDTVTLTVNGETYTGAVAGGRFAIEVQGADLAADPEASVHASVTTTDDAGNATTATHDRGYIVDTHASATITVDPITPDDVVNAIEAGEAIMVTGATEGDAAQGDRVAMTINGHLYEGNLASDGTFAIEVLGSDLAAAPTFTASVTGSDDAGNAFTASTLSEHTIDTTASAPSVEVTDASGNEDTAIGLDISAALSDGDGSELLSGITIGGVPDGAELSAGTDNGDGTWTLTQNDLSGLTVTPADNSDENFSLAVTATATELGGNTATVTETLHVTVHPVADTPVVNLQISGNNVVNEGLVGHWVFDENNPSGKTTHNLVDSREGTLTGDAHFGTSGHNNGSMVLDGSGDYVDVSGDYTDPLAGTATLSAWIKLPVGYTGNNGANIGWDSPSIIGSEQHGATNDIQWGWISDDGHINIGVGDNTGAQSDTAVNDGEWHHVILTRDHTSGETKVYVDGTLEDTQTTLAGLRDSTALSGFGATFGSDGSHSYLAGELDDIRVYDRVLTDREISQIHAYEGNSPSYDLVGLEGEPVSITLDAQPSDTDGSESITAIVLSGIPTGAVLSDGTHTFTAAADAHETDVTDWDLASLTIIAYANSGGAGESYTLKATATSTDGEHGPTATASSSLTLYVIDSEPVALSDHDSVGFGGTAVGNVILGAGGDEMLADEAGADDIALSSVTFEGATYTFDENGNLLNSALTVIGNTIVGEYGNLEIHQDGGYLYTSTDTSNATWAHHSDAFDYTLMDSDGDNSTAATLTITHDSLTAVADSAVVHEAGLAEGSDAASDSEIITGNLLDNDLGVGDDHEIVRIQCGSEVDKTTSDGTLNIDTEFGTITVYTQSDATHRAGDYKYTLNEATSGDDITDTIRYKVSDGNGGHSSSSLAIHIADDAPVGDTITAHIQESAAELKTTNLIIVLDQSGSMAFDMDGHNKNSWRFDPDSVRMDIAKDALSAMFDSYDNLGNVNIQFVRFESNAVKSGWFMDDKDGAKDYMTAIEPWGGTDYDDALDKVQENFSAPQADKTLLYFISDGEPNYGEGANKGDWEAFLDQEDNPIDIAFGIGITNNVDLDSLKPIAWPDSGEENPHAIQVLSAFDLKQTLIETVSEGVVKGDATLLAAEGDDGVLIGADGGHIQSILVDGEIHRYDPTANKTESIETARGGVIDINYVTGEYFYTINPHDTITGEQELFVITCVDGDGDTKAVDLVIKLDYVANIDANHDTIITNAALGDTLPIDFSALLANDSGPGIEDGSIQADSDTQLSVSSDHVLLSEISDGDSFHYGIASGEAKDSAQVDLTLQHGHTLDGTSGDDILINAKTASDSASSFHLNGNEGDDYLKGSDAQETLNGGEGSDTIVAGGGDDRIMFDGQDSHTDGGQGTDTLIISQSVLDFSALSNHAVENIEKLDLNADSAQSVTLTLEDVLDMTGSDNVLQVTGGTGDSITVDLNASGDTWIHKGDGLFSNGTGSEVQIVSVDDVNNHIQLFTDDGTAIE